MTGPPRSLVEMLIDRGGIRWGGPLALFLLAAMLVLGVALTASGARARTTFLRAPSSANVHAFSLLLLAGAIARVVVYATRFHLQQDDYFQLVHAHLGEPWHWDPSLRALSTTLLFRVGGAFGDRNWFFASANLLCLAVASMSLASLARRAGRTREEAFIAIAIFLSAGGLQRLVTWGVGFQQLEATALVLLALVAFDASTRETLRRRRIGLSILACALAWTIVFVKYPVAFVLPPLALIWRRVTGEPRTTGADFRGAALLATSIIVPLALAHPFGIGAGELDKIGVRHTAANSLRAFQTLRPTIVACLGVCVVIAWWGVGRESRWRAMWPRAIAEVRGQVVTFGAACLAIAPFLLNGQYFERYYTLLATAFVGLACSRFVTAAASKRNVPVWLAALLVGVGAIGTSPPNESDPRHARFESQLFAVRRLTIGLPPSRIVRVVASCDGAMPEVRALFQDREHQDGLRWAMHSFDAEIEFGGEPRADETVLTYCNGQIGATRGNPTAELLPFEGRIDGPRVATVSGAPLGGRTVGLMLLWIEHGMTLLRQQTRADEYAAERADAERVLSELCHRLEDAAHAVDWGFDRLAPADRALAEHGVRYAAALRTLASAVTDGDHLTASRCAVELRRSADAILGRGGPAGDATSCSEPPPSGHQQRTFSFDYWSGELQDCTGDVQQHVNFCTDPGFAVDGHRIYPADDESRCGSRVGDVEVLNDGCIRATVRIRGCGTTPEGQCRGHGHLRFRVEVQAHALR